MFSNISTRLTLILAVLLATGFQGLQCQDSTFMKNDSLNHIRRDTVTGQTNKQLQQFKKAFEKVITQQNIKQKKTVEEDPTLNLGVFIMNETRTPMGQQFYRSFYQNWKDLKDIGTAMITISEEPSPGLGSRVSIKIGYEKAFQARVQPKHRYIVALSKIAIKRCRKIILQKAKVRKQLAGY